MKNINTKINNLLVIDKEKKNKRYYYLCKCICGVEKSIRADSLLTGKIKSCGCQKSSNIKSSRFGRLVAIKPTTDTISSNSRWICKCDCGKTHEASYKSLKAGNVRSCGCLLKEFASSLGKVSSEKYTSISLKYGTNIRLISKESPNKKNTSGVTGVVWDKHRELWKAEIHFQNKHYFLGRFKDLKDAISARKKAEEKYFKPVLEKLKKSN